MTCKQQYQPRRRSALSGLAILSTITVLGTSPAFGQAMAPESVATRFILDSAVLLLGGLSALIFTIAFAFRDAGLGPRGKWVGACLRLSGILALGGLSYWAVGYNLQFRIEPGGFLGTFAPWQAGDSDPVAAGRASAAHFLYYFGLVAMALAIVSSAIAERVRLAGFGIFAIGFVGLIFPIAGSWIFAGGYIATELRFIDYGAATLHAVGGAAALAAAIIVGPRREGIGPYSHTASMLPAAAVSSAVMLAAMFVVSATASGKVSSIDGVINFANSISHTLLAACAGAASALFLTRLIYKRTGAVFSMAGAIGASVALAADPIHVAAWQALMIGAMSGVIVTVTSPFLRRYGIDDAGVVIAAHLFCAIWGLLIAPWYSPGGNFVDQAIGTTMVVAFSFFMSLCVWTALKFSVGVRDD